MREAYNKQVTISVKQQEEIHKPDETIINSASLWDYHKQLVNNRENSVERTPLVFDDAISQTCLASLEARYLMRYKDSGRQLLTQEDLNKEDDEQQMQWKTDFFDYKETGRSSWYRDFIRYCIKKVEGKQFNISSTCYWSQVKRRAERMPTAVWTNGTGFSLQMSRVSRGIHLIVTKECLDDRENAMLNVALSLEYPLVVEM
ncbi:hypothetical protein GEV33_015073 [Tenebrio molitor]|uniref:Uncharacterized protein n=1 Tax=Tenebrio molitor TaxID=7067 RepID=A0A8J6H403_TENMO|nr:hypothetical protein GEV33_015073 [Tenebrio molitor]